MNLCLKGWLLSCVQCDENQNILIVMIIMKPRTYWYMILMILIEKIRLSMRPWIWRHRDGTTDSFLAQCSPTTDKHHPHFLFFNFFLLPIKISIIIIASVGVVVVVVVVVVVIEDAPGTRKTQNPGDQDCLFASSTRRWKFQSKEIWTLILIWIIIPITQIIHCQCSTEV